MTGELLTAIQTKVKGNSGVVAAFPGGFWSTLAPAGTSMPYLITKDVSAPARESYGGTRDADIRIQFSAVAELKETGSPKLALVTALMDGALLTLSSGDNCNVQRPFEPVSTFLGMNDNTGGEIWGWSVDYIFSVHTG